MTSQEKKAVRLWQQAIALIWQGRCGLCKQQGNAGHHIIGRRFKDAKFCVMNGIYLCNNCHGWADKHEAELVQILRRKFYALYEWHEINKPKFSADVKWHPASYYAKRCEELNGIIESIQQG